MEILTPIQPEAPRTPVAEALETGNVSDINLKTVEFLQFLGLGDKMHDFDIMKKVDFLTERLNTVEDLQSLSIKVGHSLDSSQLDKIYAYLGLVAQEEELERQQQLLRNQIQQYGR